MTFNKQDIDIESVRYFAKGEPTNEQVEEYKEWSNNGTKISTDNPMISGKKWRDIHIGMYEEGILDGSVPYWTLMEDMPYPVAVYMSKSMFRGMDRDLIMTCWHEVNNTKAKMTRKLYDVLYKLRPTSFIKIPG